MMTHIQHQTLIFIQDELDRTGGVPPTYREMQAHLGVKSKATVAKAINALVSAGYLFRIPNRKQAIGIVHRVQWLRWDDETKSLTPLGDPFERKAI